MVPLKINRVLISSNIFKQDSVCVLRIKHHLVSVLRIKYDSVCVLRINHESVSVLRIKYDSVCVLRIKHDSVSVLTITHIHRRRCESDLALDHWELHTPRNLQHFSGGERIDQRCSAWNTAVQRRANTGNAQVTKPLLFVTDPKGACMFCVTLSFMGWNQYRDVHFF